MRPLHCFLAIFVAAIWGFNFVMLHLGLEEISPQILCLARFLGATFPAIFFVKKPDVPLKTLLLYGFLMFAMQFTFLFSGVAAGVTPGIASLTMQTQVFFTIFLAFLFLQEEPNKWQIVGAVISFSGIVLISTHINSDVSWLGLILIIGAALTWGAGNLMAKKMGKVNMLSLVIWASLVACPPLFLLALYMDGWQAITHTFSHLTTVSLSSILYIAYLSTIVAFAIWNDLLTKYPAAIVAPFTLLVPIFGMLSSALFLGETLQPWKMYAAALVISGLGINLLAPRLILRFSSKLEEAGEVA